MKAGNPRGGLPAFYCIHFFYAFFRFYAHINCNTAFHFAENIRMLLNNLPTYVIIITSGHGISAEKPAQRAKNKYK